MARLTNKAMNKQNEARQNTTSEKSKTRFDSSECRFTNRKERNANRTRVKPTNPADIPEIEFPAYTGRAGGYIEYQMPTAMAQAILDERTGAEAKKDPQKYLCDYVNTQYNLLGYCVRVVLT